MSGNATLGFPVTTRLAELELATAVEPATTDTPPFIAFTE
jgi:hypothetical protein